MRREKGRGKERVFLPLPSLTPGKPQPQSPTLLYHFPDARKNFNPLGRAALFTGKTCAFPSLPFWEYECRCSWKASKYLVHRGKSLRLNFRLVTEERNSKKHQMRRNMGSCTDPSVIFTHILYHLIRADDMSLASNCVVNVDAQMRNGLQCVAYTKVSVLQKLPVSSEIRGKNWTAKHKERKLECPGDTIEIACPPWTPSWSCWMKISSTCSVHWPFYH